MRSGRLQRRVGLTPKPFNQQGKKRKFINRLGKRGKRLAPADRTWAAAVRDRANGLCEICFKQGYHAHHIKTRAAHPELRHDLSNGIYLCLEHHDLAHQHPAAFAKLLAEVRP